GRDTLRPRGGRARLRQWRGAYHASFLAGRRHHDPLRLPSRHRRQGRQHRRTAAGRRGAGHHRTIFCSAGATGRRQRVRFDDVVATGEAPAMARGAAMKPAAFDYVRAEHLDEVLAGLASEGGDARIIAGGQSLMPMLNMRLAKPKTLIDIMRLPELARIERKAGYVTVGAGVRQAALLAWPELGDALPLVAMALPWTGHVQTRSRGTVCGSIAHADPSAELPLALQALGGEVHLRAAGRRRRVRARDFFAGMMATTRADDELIEAVAFPSHKQRCAFREVARRHGDFAIVACAAVKTSDGVRVAVGGVADTPVARDFPALDGSALDDALNAFAHELDARDDIHATARYRRDLVRMIGRDLVREVLQ